MEIKIECACGTKYKFDVEPVNGRMPAPVNCPACGAEGTAQANAILQQSGGNAPVAAPPSPRVTVRATPAPVARLSTRPVEAAPAAPPQPVAPIGLSRPRPAHKRGANWKTVLGTCLTLLVVAFGLWRFGSKWYKRIGAVVQVVQAVGGETAEDSNHNFWQEDCVVLFVRHTNHLEIAQACKDFWKARLQKQLTIQEVPGDEIGEREYCIIGAHNGYIRLTGGLEWPQPQYEGLALELSRQFNTLVFETRDVDFTGAYHFGVYEQGTRKFHAQMDIKPSKDDFDEVVTTEGNDWALAHGFKPEAEGFKEFHMGHADEIAQKMGLKMWDEKEGEQLPVLLLKEL